MLDVVIRIAAGVAGAAIFAAINSYFLMLPSGYWYPGGAVVFAVFFAIAYFAQQASRSSLQTTTRSLVASDNRSGGKMSIDLGGVLPSTSDVSSIASGNESADDMSVKVNSHSSRRN